jgi:TRAP-type transport system periplasmic protein
MKAWKAILGVITCSMAVIPVFAQAADPKIVIRTAHTTSTDYPYHIGLEVFAKSAAAKTNGQVEVKIFPNGQLGGNEREVTESVQMGTIDSAVVNSAVLGAFVPRIDVFNLPFMFRDLPHLYKALDGQPGAMIAKDLEAKGLKVLAWFMNPGRNVFNTKKPIAELADMKGMKFRTTQSQVSVATFNALGALATPMAYGEVYSAMEQGVVDGGDDTTMGYSGSKFYEVAKFYSMSGHFMVACPVMIGVKKFNGYSPAVQKALLEAAADGAIAMRKYTEERIKTDLQLLRSKGVTVTEIKDIKPFVAATEPVLKKFEAQIGKDLIEMVKNIK